MEKIIEIIFTACSQSGLHIHAKVNLSVHGIYNLGSSNLCNKFFADLI